MPGDQSGEDLGRARGHEDDTKLLLYLRTNEKGEFCGYQNLAENFESPTEILRYVDNRARNVEDELGLPTPAVVDGRQYFNLF